MPYLNISPSLTLNYIDEKQHNHPAVLLLHGLGANGSSWLLQIPTLSDSGFRILAPDLPGFGKSTFPEAGLSIKQMSAIMAELLKALNIDSAHVVGISMGGVLALQLVLDYPQMVDKLVLVNTFAKLRPSNLAAWSYFLFRFILVYTVGIPSQAKAVAKRLFPDPKQEQIRTILVDQILQANPKAYRASMRALALFDVQKRLKEIHSSTLVVTGEKDTTVPLPVQQALVAGIPNARQTFISNAGHAVIVEQPVLFNQVLLDYLSNDYSLN
jgi:3-oxoadipate enol-lactonase